MSGQADLFGANETAVRSFAPHLDPARVKDFQVTREIDSDHVAAPVNGLLPIGALGANRETWVLRVLDAGGALLAAQSFDTSAQAWNAAARIQRQLQDNSQECFF